MDAASKLQQVRVRLATRADADPIIHVVNAAFAVESFLDGTRTDQERMAASMEKGEFLLAEDSSGKIAASVYVEVNGERGYIGMLAVEPARQRSGLGRAMMEAGEAHCRERGCTFVGIAVLSLRPELPPLYRNFGYVETGTEEFKPSRPLKEGVECHVLRMEKKL